MGIFKKLFRSEKSDIVDDINEVKKIEETSQNDEADDNAVECTSDSDNQIQEMPIEELVEELTEDGELSYDEYDKVCCPECGEYLGEGVTVCKTCGYGKITASIVCPNCGKTDEDHLGFCSYCDYEFDTKK